MGGKTAMNVSQDYFNPEGKEFMIQKWGRS
jgi:hypothetical protein